MRRAAAYARAMERRGFRGTRLVVAYGFHLAVSAAVVALALAADLHPLLVVALLIVVNIAAFVAIARWP